MLVTQMKKHYANIDFLHVVQPEGAMGFSLPAAGREAVIRKIDTRVGGLTRQELKEDPSFVSRASEILVEAGDPVDIILKNCGREKI